jgi:MSHA biogenesis protein MshP
VSRPERSDTGFSLISAIFLLVIVSAACAAMLGMVGAERRGSTLGILGSRALQAARSGIEWATAKAVANPANCPSATFALTEGALTGFSVAVTCSRTQHDENGSPWSTFRLRSDAQRGTFGSFDYAFRRVESTVTVAGP